MRNELRFTRTGRRTLGLATNPNGERKEVRLIKSEAGAYGTKAEPEVSPRFHAATAI